MVVSSLQNDLYAKLFEQLKKNAEGKDFQKACVEGLFVYIVENGEKRKVRVRHVRCKVKTAQPLKRHTFQPKDKHTEQYYYVSSHGEAYGIFEYKSKDGQLIYEPDSLFTLSQKIKLGELKERPCPKCIMRKGKEYFHTRTILKEDTILVYPPKEHPEDQFKLTPAEISKRLYRINSIELPNRIKLTRHNLAESFKGRDTITDADFDELPDGFRKSVTTLKFLLLGTDFDIINGKMVPIRKTIE